MPLEYEDQRDLLGQVTRWTTIAAPQLLGQELDDHG
jgi:hypothetical protein